MLLLVGALFFAVYVFNRLSRGITRSSSCLVGKIAVITGANSGLGYQSALNLASRGCKVIMADVSDMEESKMAIIKYTNNTNITTRKLDLSSLKSVRDFASYINKTEEKLDILMNNAGIGASSENRTDDGLHPVMQINYFGHFLLTHLLIDLLKKSAPSRIVFTSSVMAFFNNLSLANLNYNSGVDFFFAQSYNNSKLAMIIASDIFAEKLNGTGVTSNSTYPGFVKTQIFSQCFGVVKNLLYEGFVECLKAFFAKDTWEGSQTLVHVAVSKKLEHVTGKFFADCKPFVKPMCAYNKKWCQQIWEASEECVGLALEEKI